MDEGLFKKHIQHLVSRSNSKQKIIFTIKEKAGIIVEESEITLSKKTVTLSTSSVKKAALLQKGIKNIIETLGYTLSA